MNTHQKSLLKHNTGNNTNVYRQENGQMTVNLQKEYTVVK